MVFGQQLFHPGFINPGIELPFLMQVTGGFGQTQGRAHRKYGTHGHVPFCPGIDRQIGNAHTQTQQGKHKR
jgi:hypothetical protein